MIVRPEANKLGVHILNQFLGLLRTQVCGKAAPHLGGKSQLAIAEGPRPTQAADHIAGVAGGADAPLGADGAEAPVQVLALLQEQHLPPGLGQLQGGKKARWPCPHNDYFVSFHQAPFSGVSRRFNLLWRRFWSSRTSREAE